MAYMNVKDGAELSVPSFARYGRLTAGVQDDEDPERARVAFSSVA